MKIRKMNHVVAIQMDAIHTMNLQSDSTLMMALEGQKRGFQVFYYTPDHLIFQNGDVLAYGRWTFFDANGHHQMEEPSLLDLRQANVILIRQDPPYNMAYLTTTYILEHLLPDVLIVNDPVSIRNAPEKLLVTHFPDLIPPTLITRKIEQVYDFLNEHERIIIKPLYASGGTGVVLLEKGNKNIRSIWEMATHLFQEPIIIQRFIPDVVKGDKRILLVDGIPTATFIRVAGEHDIRSNLHVGGTAHACDINDRDRMICDEIAPFLRKHGLLFVGIDVLGDYLIEINVTSPTGIQEAKRLSNIHVDAVLWDAIETKIKTQQNQLS